MTDDEILRKWNNELLEAWDAVAAAIRARAEAKEQP